MGVKHLMRPAIDRAAQLTGLLGHWERRMSRGVTVLMYHRVLPDVQCADAPLPGLVMPASAFENQVRWLSTHCRVVSVGQAIRELQDESKWGAANGNARRPTVALSFDDGYRDNHEHAFPVLREQGLVATFFVTTGLIGSDKMLWFDVAGRAWRRWGGEAMAEFAGAVLGEPFDAAASFESWMNALKRLSPERRATLVAALQEREPALGEAGSEALMDWDQLAEMAAQGCEVGAHSRTHALLPQLDDARLDDEVAGTRRTLEEKLSIEITGFCYPNGDHDDRVVKAVERAGYTYACTTAGGLNEPGTDPMRLKRIDVTAHRVLDRAAGFDELGFRGELCRLRDVLRTVAHVG